MLSLATLSRTHLDESFTARGGLRVRIVERPGRWMSERELAALIADLQAIVRSCVAAGSLEYGAVSGDRERLRHSVLTLVYDRDGTAVAFNALALLDCELRGRPVDVLHLGLVMVAPEMRASGFAAMLYGLTCFLVFARRQLRPLWISNVTQVPSVFGMVARQFDNVFPTARPSDRQRYDHLHLARQIMARHRFAFGVGSDAVFDERRGVILNAYTGGSDNLRKSFDEAPKHRDAQYNEICQRELDYERGDDFLQIGQFTIGVARRYFMRSASILSPAALVMRFLFMTLESFVAPALQWFATDRPMGDLRPSAASSL